MSDIGWEEPFKCLARSGVVFCFERPEYLVSDLAGVKSAIAISIWLPAALNLSYGYQYV